jgi:hypothetical protein
VSDSRESPVKDNFSTFLKKASRDWEQQAPTTTQEPPASAEEAAAAAVADAGEAGEVPEPAPPAEPADLRMELVAYLADHGPAPIPEVQAEFGIGFTELGLLFAKLEGAGLIARIGEPGAELVRLTPEGAQLAS